MIKRIIFDIDNTLIKWQSASFDFLPNFLSKHGIQPSKENVDRFINSSETFIVDDKILTRADYIAKINDENNANFLDEDFHEAFTSMALNNIAPIDLKQVATLKYLASKYEIYILTNWFSDYQALRLEKIGISEYIDEVYGFDDYYAKPSKEAFQRVCEGLDPSECLMIGDSETFDLEPALEMGMQVIKLDLTGRLPRNKNIKNIKHINELIDIL